MRLGIKTTRIAVIIATRDRPQLVSNLLEVLRQQTVRPDEVVVSACGINDVEPYVSNGQGTQVLFGSPGLTVQRNRALSLIREKYDIIVFFDDDFIPSRFWIERVTYLLETQPDVGTITGRVLRDGIRSGEIDWSTGKSIVDAEDSFANDATLDDRTIEDCKSPYGCNMAIRLAAIGDLRFDERLVLYGWLEDRDFGFRASTKCRTIFTDLIWGVHLGTLSGRTSGRRFGYSQVVNPWYLMKKGSMTPFGVCHAILRALSGNTLGTIFPRSPIDRWGRLRGNAIGIKDILLGRWAPEKVAEL